MTHYTTGALATCFADFGVHSIPPKKLERYLACMRNGDDPVLPKTKHGRGSTRYDSTAAINAALGCLLGPSDTKAATTVLAIRNLELIGATVNPFSLEHGATMDETFRLACRDLAPIIPDSCKLLTVGSALDALIDAMRMGLMKEPARIVAEFYDRDQFVNIYYDGWPTQNSICLSYGERARSAGLESIFRINGRALQKIADALGPMAIPPPY